MGESTGSAGADVAWGALQGALSELKKAMREMRPGPSGDEAVKRARVLLGEVRGAAREVQGAAEAGKRRAAEAAEAADAKRLALARLREARAFAEAEAERLEAWVSDVPEVELAPLEEFLAAQGGGQEEEGEGKEGKEGKEEEVEEMEEGEASMDEDGELSEGERLEVRRLKWEVVRRRAMAREVDDLEAEEERLKGEIGALRTGLAGLRPEVAALRRAWRPVEERLSLQGGAAQGGRNTLARLLPMPLYVAFSRLVAYRDACPEEGLEVTILGDGAEALREARAEADPSPGAGKNAEAVAGAGEGSAGGGGKRGRKRALSGMESAAKEEGEDVYAPHALRVGLKVPGDSASGRPTVGVSLAWLPRLGVVTAAVWRGPGDAPLPPNALVNLLPDDTGEGSASSSMQAGFDAGREARPFKWAQGLAGLDFLPRPPHVAAVAASAATVDAGLRAHVHERRCAVVVSRLKARATALGHLSGSLADLSSLRRMPSADALRILGLGSEGPKARLKYWKEVGAGDIAARRPQALAPPKEGEGTARDAGAEEDDGGEERAGKRPRREGAPATLSAGWAEYGARCFELTLQRPPSRGASKELELHAAVRVPSEWPLRPASFAVRLGDKDDAGTDEADVRRVEAEVNRHCLLECVGEEDDAHSLAVQVACLAACLDALCDRSDPDAPPQGGRLLARSDPHARSVRRRPFLFDADTGFFAPP